jgi:hypothetical protein
LKYIHDELLIPLSFPLLNESNSSKTPKHDEIIFVIHIPINIISARKKNETSLRISVKEFWSFDFLAEKKEIYIMKS